MSDGCDTSHDHPEVDTRPNVDAIWELIKRGHALRMLFSQNVCMRFQMRKYGGFGYDFILSNLHSELGERRVAEQDLDMMTRHNPARLLTFVKPAQLMSANWRGRMSDAIQDVGFTSANVAAFGTPWRKRPDQSPFGPRYESP